VVPDVDSQKLQYYLRHVPIKILANNDNLQAVRHAENALTEAIFYKPGTMPVEPGTSLQVDQPCMVMVHQEQERTQFTVCSPDSPRTIHVVLSTPRAQAALQFDLPGGELPGVSVSKFAILR
jgi:hypothetical protein